VAPEVPNDGIATETAIAVKSKFQKIPQKTYSENKIKGRTGQRKITWYAKFN